MVQPQNRSGLHSYILDSSSIMALPYQFPATKATIWEGIKRLVEAGRLKTVERVLEELERNTGHADGADLRLREVQDRLLVPWQPLLLRAGQIASRFPRLSPRDNPRMKADTLVLAAAEAHGLTVVCNESRLSRRRQMPAACDYYQIRCRNLLEFVLDEQLERG